MYGKIKRSIAKFILMMGMAAVFTGLLGLTSPAQASDPTTISASSASDTNESLDMEVSDKSDASTVSGDVEDVLTANAGFIGKSKKVKACKAYAEKLEQRAPPRDPQAFCSGSVKVKLFGKIVASCPTGYLGAKMTLGVSLRQVVKARAFAKSVASGRVRTWARIKIRDLAKIKGKTYIECVKIPTPPPPVVEYDKCPDIPGNQPADYVCNPTPPPPPPYDHCPNLPGDQPEGYDCYPTPPPPHDECPNLPGDQPEGYQCYPPPPPPHDECPMIDGNQPAGYDCTGPKGRIIGPLHLYERGTATYRVYGSDNTDGTNVDIDVWFTGNVTGSYVNSYTANGEKVVEFILVAGPDSGDNDHGYIHARITDQDGQEKLLEPHKIFVEKDDRG